LQADAPPSDPALALAVAVLTGLGTMRLITRRERCHGYANCCVCADCAKRARGEVQIPHRVKQPWDTA
jgi:hypothetical protein